MYIYPDEEWRKFFSARSISIILSRKLYLLRLYKTAEIFKVEAFIAYTAVASEVKNEFQIV